jgi:hypothetical protein
VKTALVPAFVAVTVAPGRTAPAGSFTVPVIVARSVWLCARIPIDKRTNSKLNNLFLVCRITGPLLNRFWFVLIGCILRYFPAPTDPPADSTLDRPLAGLLSAATGAYLDDRSKDEDETLFWEVPLMFHRVKKTSREHVTKSKRLIIKVLRRLLSLC